MTLLLSCEKISKSIGARVLFENISLGISQGDRIGFVGINGSGKSTFLRILAAIDTPDSGAVVRKSGLQIGYVPQQSDHPDLPVEELLCQQLPHLDEHEKIVEAQVTLGKLGFIDGRQSARQLSGGWQKRLDIALQMIRKPDILLLDEPTNHLDVDSIVWLENFLLRQMSTFVVITHDRRFLDHVANSVVELSKAYDNGLFASKGNWSLFCQKREQYLLAKQQQQRSMASKAREELAWVRQSAQARTTKQQARLKEADQLFQALDELKKSQQQKVATISFTASERQTHKLVTLKNVAKAMSGKALFQKIDITLQPGIRLGLVGRNGTGKTTLLKIIAGELTPDVGTIKKADDIHIVYFDQHRFQLPENVRLRDALAPDGEFVHYRGKEIHVSSWAKRFLFETYRLDLPVSELSGGEKARVLIARLMLQPADVLLLDEPTNDLDIPTLEVLEESLKEFNGAIVMITHDRALMQNIATQLLAFGIDSDNPFYADFAQWQQALTAFDKRKERSQQPQHKRDKGKGTPTKKLSYKEQRELDGMEEAIVAQEQLVDRLSAELDDVAADAKALEQKCSELKAAQDALDHLFARWQHLTDKT